MRLIQSIRRPSGPPGIDVSAARARIDGIDGFRIIAMSPVPSRLFGHASGLRPSLYWYIL
jgi:hypothetical protein